MVDVTSWEKYGRRVWAFIGGLHCENAKLFTTKGQFSKALTTWANLSTIVTASTE